MAEPAIQLVKKGGDVVLTDRSGNLVTVAEKDAAEVIGQGEYLPASAAQVAQRDHEKKYGGAAGQALAGASAVTAGAFDAAVAIPKAVTALGSRALGAKDPLAGVHGRGLQEDLVALAGEAQGRSGEKDARLWREAVEGTATENPYTTMAGRIAGEALGSVGIGAAGRGLGGLAGRGVSALGGARAATAASIGAAGATEGALLSQGQASEEDYLAGDRETTAEKTLAGMGLGAILGGGVALGLAGGARVFGRAGSRGATPVDSPHLSAATSDEALESTAARVLGTEPEPGFGAKLRDAFESTQTAATGADRETLRKYGAMRWDDEARAGREMWMNREPILEGATGELTAQVDTLLKRSKAVTREVWEVPAKEAQVRKNLGDAGDIDPLLDEINAIGVENTNYLRDGMRDLTVHRGGYQGADAEEVGRIARGEAKTRNSRRPFDPVHVDIYPDTISLGDGRHRMIAAKEAGAKEIMARVRKYDVEGNVIAETTGPVSIAPNPSPTRKMLDAAREASSALKTDVASLAEAVGPGANKRYLGDLGTWLGGIDNAVAKGSASDAYIALDRAKRAIQKKVDTLGSTLRNETNPLMLEQKRAVVDALEGAQDRVRTFLMDEAVWGAQGTAQKQANAAAERYLKNARLFERGFAADMGREYGGHGGAPIFDADPSKISSYVRSLGRQESALKDKVFREHVEATLNLAESINAGYKLEGTSSQALGELREAAKTIRDTLDKADKTVKVANQIDAVIEAERGSGAAILGSTFGGGLLGGAPGAALGALVGGVTRPGQMIRQMAAIEQLAKNVDGKVAKGLKGFFSSFADASLPGGQIAKRLPAAAKEGAAVAKRATIPSSLEAFRGKEPSAQDAYRKRVEQLTQLSDSVALTERTSAALGDMPSTAPRLAGEIAAKTSQALAFLREKLPGGIVSPTVIQPTRSALPSDLEIAKFGRYWTAVTNPLSVVQELRTGTLTHEHVEAVQTVYPKLYEHMQLAALDSLRYAATQGTFIPYQGRLQIALLLNLKGEADPTLDAGFIQRVAMATEKQKAQQKPPPGGKAPNVADTRKAASAQFITGA